MEATIAAESPMTFAGPYVDVHETHTGVVVLAGDRAYKAKKPVVTDFLDFRTPAQREHACSREVELNSRLSPSSYLGVAHLDDPSGGPAEPVVVMRRYHDNDRLSAMIASGKSVEGVLDRIAETLAGFHSRALRSPAISAQGEVRAVDHRWRANLSELRRYAAISTLLGESIDRIEHLAAEFSWGRGPLFTRRIADGCIVDGHGDLLADDIFCPGNDLALLDCLEFDDQLRYIDRIDDAAFLAMDLEFLGRRDLGDYFLERYCTYATDRAPSSLRDFYIAYRAVVRAKVECVRLSQGKSEAAANAARHVAIATQHLEKGAVRLVVIGGSPGTGKSTLARGLAERVEAQVISTDDVRHQLRKSGRLAGEPGVLNEGLYSPDNVAAVYQVVLRRALTCLSNGQSVVLDGTWSDPLNRAQARRLAAETHSALAEIVCSAAVETAAERITTRRPGHSDVTPQIAATLAAGHGGWETAHRMDTTQPLEDSLREAHKIWLGAI